MTTLAAVSKKDIVLGVYEAFGRRDIPAILDCMTGDMVCISKPVTAGGENLQRKAKCAFVL